MTNPTGFDFTKFVPGFDFLKNLNPGNASSASATAPGWVAPTLDPEELEKRIQELKTVQFWLEQNAKAVGATIQALEVQRMTLATLKGMNMSFNDLAESLKVKPQEAAPAEPKYTFTPAEPAPESDAPKAEPKASKSRSKKAETSGVDPSHWWGALTDQFQHIAAQAMTDMAHRAQAHAATETAAPAAKKTAAKTAARKSAAPKTAARKTPARKTAAKAKR